MIKEMRHLVKIIGVAEEDPLHHQTWSGSSAYFFSALKAGSHLAGTISAQSSTTANRLSKLRNIHPILERWKFRYHLDVEHYRQMTTSAIQRLNAIEPSSYNVILQIGAFFDLSQRPGKLTVGYHDGNLAVRLKSPYGYPAISQSRIKKALDHERGLYKKLDHIFTMSEWLADSFIKDFSVSSSKVTPIGAGINLPCVREISNKSYDAPHILFIGKEFERKGGRFLLEAFAKVRQEVPDATLTVIGPDLKNPPAGVTCLGYVSKYATGGLDMLLNEYIKASVFVMPSLYEPFGIVFVEAMAHKLPCIGTKICAMPEIINDNRTGFLVPPCDTSSLADRILTLLKNPGLCKSFGEAGYLKYQEKFTWSQVTEQLVTKVLEGFTSS